VHPPLLRRAQILEFIEAKGADRYKQVSIIIGLDAVDQILRAWRSLDTECKTRLASAQESQEQADRELEALRAATAGRSLLEAINQKLADLGMPALVGVDGLLQSDSIAQASAQIAQASQEALRLLDYGQSLQRIAEDTRDAVSRYESFYTAWHAFFQEKESLKEALFRELLVQGSRVLEQIPELQTCPLCLQPMDRTVLRQSIDRRVTQLEAIQKRREGLDGQRNDNAEVVGGVAQLVRDALNSPYCAHALSLRALEKGLLDLGHALRTDVLLGGYPRPEEVRSGQLSEALSGLVQESDQLVQEAQSRAPSQGEQKRIEAATWLGRAKQAWINRHSAETHYCSSQRAHDQLQIMTQALLQAREERLNEIHEGIVDRINSYYRQLHPNEACTGVQLPMERKGQGVGLRTDFHGIDGTHPLGFYSEGHLDSMGIAIFLAFTQHASPDSGLLVLDDVMTTIDSGHRQRLALLLAREFPDHQIIITTHDQLWARELAATMRAEKLECLVLHLRPWSIDAGTVLSEFLEERWDEYCSRAATNPQSAVADTGRDLERLLNRMRYNLRIAVPAREDDQYTIGDLYEALFSWFKRNSVSRPDCDFAKALSELRKDLDVYWNYRNWSGAHYNQWGEGLASTEAQAFVDLVKRLHQLVQCPHCRSLVSYDEHSSVLFCPRCKGKPHQITWAVQKQ